MKRVGYLIEQIADIDNMLLAYYKARRGKEGQQDVMDFSVALDDNIDSLRADILSGNILVGDYSYFMINDPKPRLICAAPFQQRVLHHAIMNVCHDRFEAHLIDTTYATRLGKGIYTAIERAKKASRKYPFVAKCDFRKYFDSIDHMILKQKLSRLFKDKGLLRLFDKIIDSYHSGIKGKGLPIGNLTSQYFANHYLSSLDHYCKEQLAVKEYVRYMDDFLVFAESREQLEIVIYKILKYSKDVLSLQLKTPILLEVNQGIPFCGYCIYPHKILLTSRSKHRFKHKIALYSHLLDNEQLDEKDYFNHVTPLLSFVEYAYTKQLRRVTLEYGNR